jgi:hypothetical protein
MRATIALPTAEQAVNMWIYLESGASHVLKDGGDFEAFLLAARDNLKQTFDPAHVDYVFHRFTGYVVDLCRANSTIGMSLREVVMLMDSGSEFQGETVTRWLTCVGCSGEVGLPPRWKQSTIRCPKCGAIIPVDHESELRWRPS